MSSAAIPKWPDDSIGLRYTRVSPSGGRLAEPIGQPCGVFEESSWSGPVSGVYSLHLSLNHPDLWIPRLRQVACEESPMLRADSAKLVAEGAVKRTKIMEDSCHGFCC